MCNDRRVMIYYSHGIQKAWAISQNTQSLVQNDQNHKECFLCRSIFRKNVKTIWVNCKSWRLDSHNDFKQSV